MKIVQLVDNLFLPEVIDTVHAISHVADELQIQSHVCSWHVSDDCSLPISNTSVLLDLDKDDLVLLHFGVFSSYYLWDFLSARGKKVLFYYGGREPQEFIKTRPFFARECERAGRQLSRLSSNLDFALVATSSSMKALKNLGFDGKMAICEPSINFNRLDSLDTNVANARFSNDTSSKFIAFGSVDPDHHCEDTLKAFNMYQKAYDQKSSLQIIGPYNSEDPYYLSLVRLSETLGIQNCRFLQSSRIVPACFEEADVLIVQGSSESCLFEYISAMRYGIPIVSLASETLQGVFGEAALYVSERDEIEMARGLHRAVVDADLRKGLIAKGLERSQDYSYEVAVDRLMTQICKLIRSK